MSESSRPPVPHPDRADTASEGVPPWWMFPGAEDMRRELQRDDDAVLERRHGLLIRSAAYLRTRYGRQLVDAAVRRAAGGDLQTDDASIVQLALALHDLDVRDYSLGFSNGADAAAAEKLWTLLLRSCPGTYCAAPAVLTAASAYLRGDDLRARVALDIARRADPTYRFAALLDHALDLGVPRSDLAAMVKRITTVGDAADEPTWS